MTCLKKTHSFSTALKGAAYLLLMGSLASCSEDLGLSGDSNPAFKEWNELVLEDLPWNVANKDFRVCRRDVVFIVGMRWRRTHFALAV